MADTKDDRTPGADTRVRPYVGGGPVPPVGPLVAPLRVWMVATFHTLSFVVAVVAVVHAGGSLADRLARLDTTTGVLLFLAFWATTWGATRAGLRKIQPDLDEASSGSMVMSTTVAGGLNGVVIFAILLIGFAFRLTTGEAGLATLPVLFLTAAIGTTLAFTTGAVVGMAYGLIDAALLGCSAALFRWARRGQA
jgi:hypothetical protein